MKRATEVAIVGGGAAGCSVAYHLAKVGIKSTIIEREGIASQASGFSAGGLNPLQGAGIPGPLGPFAMESFRMHLDMFGELQSGTGISYDGRIISLVKVAFDEAGLPELQETFDIFAGADDTFEAQMLEPKDVMDWDSRVAPDVIRGVHARGNAALDSYKYTLALVQAAEKLGVTVRSGTVRGLERSNGRVTGVLLGDGVLSCDAVVLAMGPWSREAEAWLDTHIPVDPLKGEILRVELADRRLSPDLSGAAGSFHPKPDGQVFCGSTEEWQGFDREPSDTMRQNITRDSVRLMPDMAQARLVLHTACLRPVTADWLPIIGLAPGYENAYLATGAGKKGVLLSPGIGKAVSDLISQGETPLSIGPFDPQRFAGKGD
jgi:glycine oxidase